MIAFVTVLIFFKNFVKTFIDFLFSVLSFLWRENRCKIFNDNQLMMKNLIMYFFVIAVFFRCRRPLS